MQCQRAIVGSLAGGLFGNAVSDTILAVRRRGALHPPYCTPLACIACGVQLCNTKVHCLYAGCTKRQACGNLLGVFGV